MDTVKVKYLLHTAFGIYLVVDTHGTDGFMMKFTVTPASSLLNNVYDKPSVLLVSGSFDLVQLPHNRIINVNV